MRKLKDDNGGFTLAELLIAIAIMAIVLTPLFHNFIESTKLNAKAKKAMNATNMASNIMEGLSAYSAEEIIIGFDSADNRGNLTIFPDDITCAAHGEVIKNPDNTWSLGYTITGTSPNGIPSYVTGTGVSANTLSLSPSADSKYYFFAQGVQQNKTLYDMLITMDASADSSFSGDINENGIIDAGESELYNDYSAVEISTINGLVDSVYKDNSTIWSDAYSLYEPYKMQGRDCTESNFIAGTKRKIVIDINQMNDPLTGEEGAEVIVHNEYKCNVNPWYPPYSVTDLSTPDNTIFSSTRMYPREIYVYYYPNYNSTNAGSNALDQIEINNTLGKDIVVHLMRLAPSGDTNLANHEANYKTHLVLNDNTDSSVHTKIYSNLKDDLTKTDMENQSNRLSATRCTFMLNGVMLDAVDPDYLAIVTENGGITSSVSDRLYKIDVQVYEEGAAANGFPEDMRVAVYDGGSARQ